jgi:hypothetical protein
VSEEPIAAANNSRRELVTGIVVLAVLVALAAYWFLNAGGIACYPVAHTGWTFECEANSGAPEKADEQFPPQLIAVAERQGEDLTRAFRGTRWLATVKVESGKKSVEPGTYKMYGTVESIDGLRQRIRFRDCAFVK